MTERRVKRCPRCPGEWALLISCSLPTRRLSSRKTHGVGFSPHSTRSHPDATRVNPGVDPRGRRRRPGTGSEPQATPRSASRPGKRQEQRADSARYRHDRKAASRVFGVESPDLERRIRQVGKKDPKWDKLAHEALEHAAGCLACNWIRPSVWLRLPAVKGRSRRRLRSLVRFPVRVTGGIQPHNMGSRLRVAVDVFGSCFDLERLAGWSIEGDLPFGEAIAELERAGRPSTVTRRTSRRLYRTSIP